MAGDNEQASTQWLQSSYGTSSYSLPKQSFFMNQLADIPQLNMPQFHGTIQPTLGFENSTKTVGIPPSHPQIPPISPYSQIPVNRPNYLQNNFSTSPGPSHNRSLSQPSFFALDSLPPLSPSPFRDPPPISLNEQVLADMSMDGMGGSSHSPLSPSFPFTRGGSLRIGESLPPLKAHRRSSTDIPFGFTSIMQSSQPLMPLRSPGAMDNKSLWSLRENLNALVMKGVGGNDEATRERKAEEEAVDDLFSAYMNLENIEAFNSPAIDEKLGNENREDLDSGTKTNGGDNSDNEAASSVNEGGSSARKRDARGEIAPTTKHYRSVSMDSFMGNINFGNESPKMLPSPGPMPGQLSPTNSVDANPNAFSLELGNGEFTGADIKKIMASEKLAEIALKDPKRAKRILANRQSACRSKERKMRYVAELEQKVQTLQTEAASLSAQLEMLQRGSNGLNNQNNEMKFRLQAMEQQAQLRDALNEALTSEVQRLKLVTAELRGDTSKFQDLSISRPQMIPLHQLQPYQYQFQHQSNSTTSSPNE